jgi:rhodanese-related sulfurtransferase
MKKKMRFFAALGVSWALVLMGSLSFAGEATRITQEEVKAMLGSPDLILIDIRTGRDWDASEMKIKGAFREDPRKSAEWADKYDKGKTIVLYCA